MVPVLTRTRDQASKMSDGYIIHVVDSSCAKNSLLFEPTQAPDG